MVANARVTRHEAQEEVRVTTTQLCGLGVLRGEIHQVILGMMVMG